MRLVVLNCGSGNLRSMSKALEWALNAAGVEGSVTVSNRPEEVASSDRIVMPGQGAFASCRQGLMGVKGLEEALTMAVFERGRPFFGVCVGMQLLVECGKEHGDHNGLGWIGGVCDPLDATVHGYKIPHMGWNELTVTSTHPVLDGIKNGDHAYFVHSYHLTNVHDSFIHATTYYGRPIVASIGRDNIIATQFHVEKSQITGLRMLTNFIRWQP